MNLLQTVANKKCKKVYIKPELQAEKNNKFTEKKDEKAIK